MTKKGSDFPKHGVVWAGGGMDERSKMKSGGAR
jgi:hypothetical protein